MFLHLLIVVKKADRTEHQGKQEDIQVGIDPLAHLLPASGYHRHADAQDEHQPSHGGRAGLSGVPLGAVLPYALPGLHPAQSRQNDLSTYQHCDGKTD